MGHGKRRHRLSGRVYRSDLAQKWRKKYGIDIICDGAFLFLLGSRFYRSDFPDWREISATLKRIYLISDVTGRDGQVSDNGIMGPEQSTTLGLRGPGFFGCLEQAC
jgi:hypothetical protein